MIPKTDEEDAWIPDVSDTITCQKCDNNRWYIFFNLPEKSLYGDCEICNNQQILLLQLS